MIIELKAQAILRLPDVRGTTLTCLDGALWITHDGDRRDIVLEPGASYACMRKGTLVQAVRSARIEIQTPRDKATYFFANALLSEAGATAGRASRG